MTMMEESDIWNFQGNCIRLTLIQLVIHKITKCSCYRINHLNTGINKFPDNFSHMKADRSKATQFVEI